MLPEFLGRVVWGAGRLALKYVVIPIAMTAAAAFVLGGLAERVRLQREADQAIPDLQSRLDA